jgi:hypothetical protein
VLLFGDLDDFVGGWTVSAQQSVGLVEGRRLKELGGDGELLGRILGGF